MYIYIRHLAYPVQAPSITSIAKVIACNVVPLVDSITLLDRNKGSLPEKTGRDENDINEEDTNEDAGRKDDHE